MVPRSGSGMAREPGASPGGTAFPAPQPGLLSDPARAPGRKPEPESILQAGVRSERLCQSPTISGGSIGIGGSKTARPSVAEDMLAIENSASPHQLTFTCPPLA